MSECPDERCRKEVDALKKYVWGREGEVGGGIMGKVNEVKSCAKEKVPKSWLWKFVTTFGVILFICGASTWYTAKSAEEKTQRLETVVTQNAIAIRDLTKLVHENQIGNVKCQEQLKAIDKKLDEIKQEIKKP